MSLNPVDSQTPVTALLFQSRNCLLAGVGSTLTTFDLNGTKLNSVKVLSKNKIHGIVNFEQGVLVWGGRSLAIIDGSVREFGLHDWIVAVTVNGPHIYIQTAHNEVVVVDSMQLDVIKTQKSNGERSILYSGSLYSQGNSVVCAAGTVMGGVVVWDVSSGDILHNFTDHEGSIFNVAFSEDGKYLASCSDDWSIIVWDLDQNKLLARGWGHAARIWQLEFHDKFLYSVSEDCTVRKWDFRKDQLECVDIFMGHQGRNVWSLALLPGTSLMATGGGDGKLLLWDTDKHRTRQTFMFSSVVSDDSPLKKATGKRLPNFKNCVVRSNLLVGVLTSGDVLFTRLPTETGETWSHVGRKLDPYALLRPVNDVVLVVGRDGRAVAIDSAGSVREFDIPDHGNLPLKEVLVLNNGTIMTQGQDHTSRNLVVYDVFGRYLYSVACPAPDFALTAATLHGNTLVVGSRFGSLAVASIQTSQSIHEPAHNYPKALREGRDGITSIRVSHQSVFVADRAGAYGSFNISEDLSLEQVMRNRFSRATIEGTFEKDGDLIVYGFKNEKFMMWNITADVELFAEDCGSRKRAWSIDTDGSITTFAYLRNNNVACVQDHACAPKLLIPGTHGREVRDLDILRLENGRKIIASAGEDTTVVLSWLDRQVVPALRLHRHTSAVQCVKWHPDHASFLVTAGGKGEIIAWRVTLKDDTVYALEAGRVAVIKNVTSELRVMDIALGNGVVVAAYSDSTIRVFGWTESPTGQVDLELVSEGRYSDRCLLNVDLVKFEPDFYRLLVTSTDGHLVVWDGNDLTTILQNPPSLRVPIHQSGVRCSAIEVNHSNKTVGHFSGGEDNSICGYVLGPESIQKVFSVPSAHASTVTGVALYDSEHILTTSADQKVRLWNKSDGSLIQSAFSDVSDTGTILALDGEVLVAGCGMQQLEVVL